MFYHIEKITGDNRRPNMPDTGYIIRYGVGDFGWKYCKTFNTLEELQEFVKNTVEENKITGEYR
jgi:hypothetical protein